MLNASNETGPRQIPIGIPGNVLDINISEDNLPVVFYWWPSIPTLHWRADASLSNLGLNTFNETAITCGAIGYGVNSDSQLGGKSFRGKLNYTINHFGSEKVEMNINGPISNGWSYTASAYLYNNPGTYKFVYGDNIESTQMYKAGLTKVFNNKKGNISVLYKHCVLKDEGTTGQSYAVFRYKGDGSVTQVPGIKLGTTSIIQQEGILNYMDIMTGQKIAAKLNDDNTSKSYADEFTGLFKYNFNNGMRLEMSAKYQNSNENFALEVPVSMAENVTTPYGYSYYGTGLPFSGSVQTTAGVICKAKIKDFFYTAELRKLSGDHNFRLGLNEWNTNIQWNRSSVVYFQEVAAQPHLLTNSHTGTFFQDNTLGEAYKGYENRAAIYFTDDWDITKHWNVNYGARAEYQKINVDNLPYVRYSNFYLGSTNSSTGQVANWVNNDRDFSNLVFTASTVYKITNPFGVLGDLNYTQQHNHISDYAGAAVPSLNVMPITMGRVGIYYNHQLFSLVSALSYIEKDNYFENRTMTNPDNTTISQSIACSYDAVTYGWTTDIVATPFKSFKLHFLLTIQDPKYKSYKFTAFNKAYDFSGKTTMSVSKVLMEIDPTYNISKSLSLWASFRYFGQQYTNLSNALYFNPHWETFCGIKYQMNKNVNVGLNIINILNQTGAQGLISGSDLMTDASKYKNYLMTGYYIRPFTAECKVAINF